jgi:hypothetical protein
MATGVVLGAGLGAGTAVVNHVPILLGEVGEARADRSAWSQSAEFASLTLDSGWAWAALAVVVGWLVSRRVRPMEAVLAGALGGCVALLVATVVYEALEAMLQEGVWGGWRLHFWLVLAVVSGPPLGAVGATIRRSGPVGVLAALVVPVGAAVNMVVAPLPAESLMAVPVTLTVWGAAAAATVVVVARAIRARRHGAVPARAG